MTATSAGYTHLDETLKRKITIDFHHTFNESKVVTDPARGHARHNIRAYTQ